MRFLVTGGCGFIGSHLVDALINDGHSVIVLDNLSTGKKENLNSKASLYIGDIRSHEDLSIAASDIDGCFHMAAIASVDESRVNWSNTSSVNLLGTINIFENSAKTSKFPIVFASSAAVYGEPVKLPLTEISETNPKNSYGVDKLSCEFQARIAAQIHGVSNIGLRFFNVYGPRQDPLSPYSGVISIFFRKIQSNYVLPIFGDGEQSRDFIYIDDVVTAITLSMNALIGNKNTINKVYNVCSGVGTTLNQLAAILSQVVSKDAKIEYHEQRAGDIRHSLGSPVLAAQELGFLHKYQLYSGLKKTICTSI